MPGEKQQQKQWLIIGDELNWLCQPRQDKSCPCSALDLKLDSRVFVRYRPTPFFCSAVVLFDWMLIFPAPTMSSKYWRFCKCYLNVGLPSTALVYLLSFSLSMYWNTPVMACNLFKKLWEPTVLPNNPPKKKRSQQMAFANDTKPSKRHYTFVL